MLKRVKDKAFLERVKNSEEYAFIISEIREWYEKNRSDQIEELSFTDRWLTYKKGDRATFEKKYFKRRHHLAAAAVLALLEPENEQYKNEVNNLLWATCGEYSWVVPAHTSGVPEEDFKWIDLFCAETGFMVAEMCDVLGDIIEPSVRSRVRIELNRRVIEPWVTNNEKLAWKTGISNWSAVCCCGTAAVLYYERPDLFEKYMPQFIEGMDYFKMSFADDGTCIEGPSYWQYGFGYFSWLAEMVRTFTGGEVDLFDEKAIKMAGYLDRSFLCGNCSISFSDSTDNARAPISIMHYLHSRFPNDVQILPQELCELRHPNILWACFIRALEYYNPTLKATDRVIKDYYLPHAQQALINRENYSFAIKTGSNKEPHNQLDVGSMIFADKNGQALCDLGAPMYEMAYFDNNTRYDFLCASSRGHCVPIINGELQKDGPQYKGSISYENGVIKAEFGAAYGIKELDSLVRTVVPKENGIVLTDSASGEIKSFISRMVARREPTVKEGSVTLGATKIFFAADKCRVQVSSENYKIHSGAETTVYLIDFIDTSGKNEVELNITAE